MNAQASLASAHAECPEAGVLSSSPHPALAAGERWYAVHTLPCNEARAEWHLGNQSFRTFLPKRRRTIRHARKLRTVEASFFPRYLFVVLDLSRHQWRSINGTYGVSRLVMCGDEPHPVPRGVVEALIASADAKSKPSGFSRTTRTRCSPAAKSCAQMVVNNFGAVAR